MLVAAFGDAGHAFPAFALARELKGRGHEVLVESWDRWQDAVEGEGLMFEPAQQYEVFPPPGPDTPQGQVVAQAAMALGRLMEEFRPDLAVCDILTRAPALAAEAAGVPVATLIPHVYPVMEHGKPMYSLGLAPPRTPLGRAGWRATMPVLEMGLRQGRRELNRTREQLGLAPEDRFHGGISRELALVATYPQLEYPRGWPQGTHVTGPLFFELPAEVVRIPAGDEPLVVVAPSTAQDPECRMLRAALQGLAGEGVRVLATTNGHEPEEPIEVPGNAVLVEWLSYSQAMAGADLVVSHGGHGTVCRALQAGAPVLVCPAAGDMSENGARVAWAGVGESLPRRLVSARGIRIAARRVMGVPKYRERAQQLALWSRQNDGAGQAAKLCEERARAGSAGTLAESTSRRNP